MKKNTSAIEGLLWLIMILPALYLLWNYPSLPDRVPIHFDAQGNPNGYGPKSTLWYFILGLNLGVYILMKYIPIIDPKSKLKNINHYPRLRVIMQLLFSLISALLVYSAGESSFNTAQLISLLLCFLFSGLGNYFPTIKPNYFLGIRTPWTLENEYVWRKTHQKGGKLWFYGGIVMAAIVLVIPADYAVYSVVAAVLISTVYLMYYSYAVFQEVKKENLG